MAGNKNRKAVILSKADLELKKENKAIASIGPKWKERKAPIHIALERLNINYIWDENSVIAVKAKIGEGVDLTYLMDCFNRPENDLRALIFEFALLGEISRLPKGF